MLIFFSKLPVYLYLWENNFQYKKKNCSYDNVELYCIWNFVVSLEQYLLSQYDPHPRNEPVELGVGKIHLC